MADNPIKDTGVIFRKEFLDTIRDRRALASMILVPLVVIPLVLIGMGGLSVVLMQRAEAQTFRVMVLGASQASDLVKQLGERPNILLVPEVEDAVPLIVARQVNAVVDLPEGFEEKLEAGEVPAIRILTYEGEMKSGLAAQAVESFLRGFRADIMRERLDALGLEEEFLTPFTTGRENVAPPERVGGNLLGGVLPYLLIILCLTGAIYPAMDLTVGEKERGTMETLLCSPVPRTRIVMGKFMVVVCFSILTALLALGTLGASFWVGMTALRAHVGEDLLALSVSPSAVASVFLLLVPVAVLFSAILLAVSLFARSHKEAQTYISPLMIAAILPAAVAALPGVELSLFLTLIPILNISLVGREILSGVFPWPAITFVFLSTCAYGAAALALAVRLFNREEVVFRSS